jgi:hypothetical protein
MGFKLFSASRVLLASLTFESSRPTFPLALYPPASISTPALLPTGLGEIPVRRFSQLYDRPSGLVATVRRKGFVTEDSRSLK